MDKHTLEIIGVELSWNRVEIEWTSSGNRVEIKLKSSEYSLDFHSISTRYSLDFHSTSTRFSLDVHSISTRFPLDFRSIFIGCWCCFWVVQVWFAAGICGVAQGLVYVETQVFLEGHGCFNGLHSGQARKMYARQWLVQKTITSNINESNDNQIQVREINSILTNNF